MNECGIVKMGHRRTTLLSLVFVSVGMMFLVPIITGEALGITHAKVVWVSYNSGHRFSIAWEHLDDGKYDVTPHCIPGPVQGYGEETVCSWTTSGGGAGAEKGWVKVHIDWGQDVTFFFSNPAPLHGSNTCDVEPKTLLYNFRVSCSIPPQGNEVTATYDIDWNRLACPNHSLKKVVCLSLGLL
jgi:hypothetical protein